MRISTSLLYSLGVDAIGRAESDMLHTQQQISSGRRLLTPADDPVAAAQALKVTQASAQNDQYSSNIDTAKSALSLSDGVLSQVTDLLQSVRTTAVNAGNGVLSDSDRASLATELGSRLSELLGLANSKDGEGRYMFSGFQTGTEPFAQDASGTVAYNGDQGRRELQVASSRQIAVSDSGASVFQAIRNGNGVFVATPGTSNAGTGVIDAGSVVSGAVASGDTYTLRFHVAGAVTTYDVVDATTATTLSTGNAYTSGSAITVAGREVTITGAPADNDSFSLAPSTSQSMFDTIRNLIGALGAPVTSAADRARLANGVNQALSNIDLASNNVLAVRAGVGASLRELDSLTAANQDRNEQYQTTLSNLQDLDYSKALSDFSRQQLALDAAQKSFLKVTGLSLFSDM